MSAVTRRQNCYVFVCAGCDNLAQSERRHATTCSGACRVRAHRSGRVRDIKALCKPMEITAASMLQAKAISVLLPELTSRIMAGDMTIDEAQPAMCNAFAKVLRALVEATR